MDRKYIKVTIVVPVYGVEKYIHKCLDSIEAQNYNDLEVILVNDCTNDDSMTVVNDFISGESQRPSMYRIINHERNLGLSEARNTGIKEAKGDYIYFLDSDDYISFDCISGLADCAKHFDADIVFGNIVRIRKQESIYAPCNADTRMYDRMEILNMYSKDVLYREAFNKLIRKSYLLKYGLFFVPGMLNEDVNWTFRMLAHPFKAAIYDQPTYNYVQEREGSIMATVSLRNYEASIKNLEIIDDIIQQFDLKNDLPYLRYYVSMIKFTIWFLFYHKNSFVERLSLYKKFRERGIDFHGYYTRCGIEDSFENLHLRLKCTNYAFAVFEFYNTWRRIKGRIKHG